MELEIIILAAGKGRRMHSDLPKVLHPIAGQPMLTHVLATARRLKPRSIHVVYGHGGALVQQTIADDTLHWIEQPQQLGTGHAVEQALPQIADTSTVLVLYGDVPLLTAATLHHLLSGVTSGGIAILTVMLRDASGYGRIIRDQQGRVTAIAEQHDATPEQLQIREGNTGVIACNGAKLRGWLQQLENNNAQGEFYLTDIVSLAQSNGVEIHGIVAPNEIEVSGVNDLVQLAKLERYYQTQQAEALLRAGVTIIDPLRFDQRGELLAGRDCQIDICCTFEGKVQLGDRVQIGANCVLRDVTIGNDVVIEPLSVITEAQIGDRCTVGPFARIRPGTRLDAGVRVGNFVEVKNSTIGSGSKLSHLSYLGDTTMGSDVNIGAGTITCNYDGIDKHRTEIGDRVFIGSSSQLVAPVKIGSGATIGAGSTITKDAPEELLTLSRSPQKSVTGWNRQKQDSKNDRKK